MEENEIHLWLERLADLDDQEIPFEHFLSPEERERVNRYYFNKDKRRFTLSRGFLRLILGHYVGLDPKKITIVYGHRGKPALPRDLGNIRFNLSHSEGVVLLAVANGREVGVDVEKIQILPEMEQIAMRFFSKPEREEIYFLPDSKKLETFFRIWTKKEAYLKATGFGLHEGENNALQELSGWQIATLKPMPGYVGAICIQEQDSVIGLSHCGWTEGVNWL